MKRLLIVLSIIGLILLGACSQSQTKQEQPKQAASQETVAQKSPDQSVKSQHPVKNNPSIETYDVIKVIDGDTLKVKINGKEETVRLLLVDTPETVHPNKPVQPFGPEASQFTKQLLTGKKVKLELDVSERDKYGRVLAYVYTEDGQMVNEMLLEKGLARVAYVYAPNTKYVDQFRRIQAEAQKKAIGIWSIENYATDRGFNDQVASENQKGSGSANLRSKTPNPPQGSCNIKGNINTKGEKIYHMPNSPYYDRTKAEQMFCTEKEAQDAGFRKAR